MCDKESLKLKIEDILFKRYKKESKVFKVNNSTISYTHYPTEFK